MSSFRVEKNEGQQRLDRFLQARLSVSRKKVKSLIDDGLVFIGGRKVIIASWEVRAGESVEVREEVEGGDRHPKAEEYFLKVVFEDPHLIVVEKDADIPCEPTPQATSPTILEILNAYFRRKHPHISHHYIGPVHRLDRETSGLMVFTKTKEANRISEQFKRHTIKRRYLSLVHGAVGRSEGKIEGFLKKSLLLKGGRKVKPSTEASGQRAVTQWNLIERYENISLIEVTLNTGRTHQIRVQMASIGHPVVGDKIYGGVGVQGGIRRQALHASYLSFRHPITGKKMEFKSKLPRDLRRVVDSLRVGS